MNHVKRLSNSGSGAARALLLVVAGCLLFGASSASASAAGDGIVAGGAGAADDFAIQSVITVGGPWQEFLFGSSVGDQSTACGGTCVPSSGGNSVEAPAPPYDFVSAVPVKLTVTDAFLTDTRFEAFDNGVSLGQTDVNTPGMNCGSDPEVCILDPAASNGSFILAPGSHSITIFVSATTSLGGAAYFRTDQVAAPLCDPALSPHGCWHFDEPPASTTAIDSSTFGNHGSYLGGPTLGVPGVANTAVSLDGVDDIVRVPDANSLDLGDSFTLEGWIKRSSASATHTMFNKGANGFQLAVMNAGAGSQVFLRKTNVSTIARSSVAVPADGSYHHVVATKNGTTVSIYVDGADVTVPVAPTQIVQNTAFPLLFGSGASVPASFDEFAVYDQALTAGEVSARYNAGAPVSTG